MPARLNLDIFSPNESEKKDGPTPAIAPAEPQSKQAKTPGGQKNAPKFVPVGFHHQHLVLLDKAVLELRHSGHWKVSKSAIIRRLIDQNADELVNVFLGKKK